MAAQDGPGETMIRGNLQAVALCFLELAGRVLGDAVNSGVSKAKE